MQQIDRKDIQWVGRIPESKTNDALMAVGNCHWSDVQISTEAFFESSQIPLSMQYIAVVTRFYPQNFAGFNEPNPVG
ncbi:MAG: hypothetical protein IRZ03_11010 [Acidobacterium ailaaui]|nr:hypothetical protein [Pseudacidobacterium ailaaui]